MSNGIRAATKLDVDIVHKISLDAYRAAYEMAVGYVPKPAREDYRQRITQGDVFVAEDDAGVAGFSGEGDRAHTVGLRGRPRRRMPASGTPAIHQ